jgi:hypothetical protein
MADGPPGIRRVFTRDRNNLDSLFRGYPLKAGQLGVGQGR